MSDDQGEGWARITGRWVELAGESFRLLMRNPQAIDEDGDEPTTLDPLLQQTLVLIVVTTNSGVAVDLRPVHDFVRLVERKRAGGEVDPADLAAALSVASVTVSAISYVLDARGGQEGADKLTATVERNEWIVAQMAEGATAKATADELARIADERRWVAVGERTVAQIAKDHGIHLRPGRPPKKTAKSQS